MRHNHFLESVKSGGNLARNVRFDASKSRWEVIFAFCVTGAIVWKRVNASVSFSRGRRSTLQCGVSHLRGRRSTLWRAQSPFP